MAVQVFFVLACAIAHAHNMNDALMLVQRYAKVEHAAPGAARVSKATTASESRPLHAPKLMLKRKQRLAKSRSHKLAQAPTTTTPDPTGMSLNTAGDLEILLSGLVANVITGLVMIFIFATLRMRYPEVYSRNTLDDKAPKTITKDEAQNDKWSWYKASMETTREERIETCGLDNAMLIEFTNLGMKIMQIVGVPMICIMGPMNCAFGGFAAGEDYLSYLSFGNVENGSWLYWIHAFVIWGVVFAVQVNVYAAQKEFVKLRFDWLKKLSPNRANTVLVEGIPDNYQSDARLKEYFDKMFPGKKVKDAYCVKETTELKLLATEYVTKQAALAKAKADLKKHPDVTPMIRVSFMSAKEEAIPYYEKQLAELEPKIRTARKELDVKAKKSNAHEECEDTVYGCNGFVTFVERRDAEIALRMEFSADRDEWVVSTPPEATQIIWNDIAADPKRQTVKTLIGYGCVAGLYFAYLPMVIGITNIANTINMGPLQSIWAAIAPTLGLQFMVAFLPTFLILVFSTFFTLKAETYAQHKLQIWYFAFQVFFVILATAVGQDVATFLDACLSDPLSIPMVFARTLPPATHFYMNFLILQWAAHCSNVMRLSNLFKYKGASAIFDEPEDIKKLSEPEDQDYYGLGSRSARFAINLCIGIVYGTLSPPVNFFCWVNFWVCRVIYGYLIPFAEMKKGDLGGVFWVSQLKSVFVCNIIYCILMAGVLCERATTWGPCMIAAPSVIYVIWSMQRFDNAFSWERLPFEVVVAEAKKQPAQMEYSQPELTQPDFKKK